VTERPRLPEAALPALGGGVGAPLRERRQGTVLALLRAPVEGHDVEWIRGFASQEASLREWDGRALVVLEGEDAAAAASLMALALPVPTLVDRGSVLARAAGVAAPALLITDQYGEVYASKEAANGWMPLDEIVAWLKYLSIRCAG
jgi:hypothetical protein